MVERSCTPNPAPKKKRPTSTSMNWMVFSKNMVLSTFFEKLPTRLFKSPADVLSSRQDPGVQRSSSLVFGNGVLQSSIFQP